MAFFECPTIAAELLRAEYVGRGTLANRQQKLNKHLHDLMRFGDLNNALILVTNQVMSKPNTFFGDPTKPVGGHVLGHTSTFRICLRKSKGRKENCRTRGLTKPDGRRSGILSDHGRAEGLGESLEVNRVIRRL